MLQFLHVFVNWLFSFAIIPREVLAEDVNEERQNKTYLMNLPESPSNVFCVRQYNQRLPGLVGNEAGVRYIQLLVRNESQGEAILQIQKIFDFLKVRPEYIEDIDDSTWVIISCTMGPIKLEEDSQGRYIYCLSVPITTNS